MWGRDSESLPRPIWFPSLHSVWMLTLSHLSHWAWSVSAVLPMTVVMLATLILCVSLCIPSHSFLCLALCLVDLWGVPLLSILSDFGSHRSWAISLLTLVHKEIKQTAESCGDVRSGAGGRGWGLSSNWLDKNPAHSDPAQSLTSALASRHREWNFSGCFCLAHTLNETVSCSLLPATTVAGQCQKP